MVIWIVRMVFLLLVFSFMILGLTSDVGEMAAEKVWLYQWLGVLLCTTVLLLGFTIDLLVPRKNLAALAGVFFGLVVGVLIGLALSYVMEIIYITYDINEISNPALYKTKGLIIGLINIFCCYLAIIFIMQTKDDFRFIIPYVEFSKQTKGSIPLVLDTSVIIDGRIADIAATKILTSQMVIPRFILNELQLVADSADRLRRNRGRRGLDVLNKMQSNKEIDLAIEEISLTDKERSEPTDLQLVSAAKKLAGRIVTNDYNLNKVASLRGVEVVNINDLAGAVKSVVLPGEEMRIRIIKSGDQPSQGVGFLDDGTMVVVENARKLIGHDVDVIVTSALQTSAGKMVFGKCTNEGPGNTKENS